MARVRAAVSDPVVAAFARAPGSIRRTCHVDMHPGGDTLRLEGAARDLATGSDGPGGLGDGVLAIARLRADVGPDGELLAIEVTRRPDDEPIDPDALVGRPVRRGFRRALAETAPGLMASRSPLALLLDDLPVAALVSGYARLYRGDIEPASAKASMQPDICAGWRADGAMMTSVRAGEGIPVTIGPPAPSDTSDTSAPSAIDDPDHPADWHRMGPLPAGSMRRRRLVDVIPDVTPDGRRWQVAATFRDTYADADGVETVLHEYTLTATIDADTGRFLACQAAPRVLPWGECPAAAASAADLVGTPVSEVREIVGRGFRGTGTCTHLNDLLRSLGDVPTLVGALARTRPEV